MIHCTGHPVGVIRTHNLVTNFEPVAQWRHLQSGGNSGIFVWATPDSIKELEKGKGRLPTGIEVQVLDHGYKEQYEKDGKRKADWFTTNGERLSRRQRQCEDAAVPSRFANGERSFPRKNLSKGIDEWNHYYVRAINGEIRLWVNGEEVSGGTKSLLRPVIFVWNPKVLQSTLKTSGSGNCLEVGEPLNGALAFK